MFKDGECEIPDTLLSVCQRGDTCTLWHVKVPRLQLQKEGAAKKMPSRETVGQLGLIQHILWPAACKIIVEKERRLHMLILRVCFERISKKTVPGEEAMHLRLQLCTVFWHHHLLF